MFGMVLWACAESTVIGPPEVEAPLALPAALAPLALPIEPGTLAQATDNLLEVDYPADTDTSALSTRWTDAMRSAGFVISEPRTSTVASIWQVTRGNEHYWSLSVVKVHGQVEVHLAGLWVPL